MQGREDILPRSYPGVRATGKGQGHLSRGIFPAGRGRRSHSMDTSVSNQFHMVIHNANLPRTYGLAQRLLHVPDTSEAPTVIPVTSLQAPIAVALVKTQSGKRIVAISYDKVSPMPVIGNISDSNRMGWNLKCI